MKLHRVLLLSALCSLFVMSGCGKKSAEFYSENPDKMREVIAECNAMGAARYKNENCLSAIRGNALAVRAKTIAISKAEKDSLQKFQAEVDANNAKK